MSDAELEALAEDWIADWSTPQGPRQTELGGSFDIAWELCRDTPERALDFVLAVLRRNHSNRVLESLSAGPLEDILATHGERMIDRVEAEARSNPMFARLLGGVWQNKMPDHIWARVQAIWDRKGWDGIPE
jgi:hypothetical protein